MINPWLVQHSESTVFTTYNDPLRRIENWSSMSVKKIRPCMRDVGELLWGWSLFPPFLWDDALCFSWNREEWQVLSSLCLTLSSAHRSEFPSKGKQKENSSGSVCLFSLRQKKRLLGFFNARELPDQRNKFTVGDKVGKTRSHVSNWT